MKKYVKPTAQILTVLPSENLSNLAGWLEHGGSDYDDAQMTTYVLVS